MQATKLELPRNSLFAIPLPGGARTPAPNGRILSTGGKGTGMIWDRIERNWQHYKGNAKRHWAKLSDEQLELVAGNRDQLAGKIQEVYGVSKEIAEKQLESWQRAQKENSPFK